MKKPSNTLKNKYQRLRLVLGDQLNASHSWYRDVDDSTLYVIAELKQEAIYTTHHVQKICAFFASMTAFANALRTAGHHVCYLTLDETEKYKDLKQLITTLCKDYSITQFDYQRPDEYRLLQQLKTVGSGSEFTSEEYDSEHFLLPFEEIPQIFTAEKHHKMEFFYRKMRQRLDVLMDDGDPLGGKWNYDGDNRNKLKKEDLEKIPEPLLFSNDVSDILERLERHNIETIGKKEEQLLWPITRQQALELLQFFCFRCLPYFGQFQDAMTANSEHRWSLYHSRLSFALNSKILSPLQVVNTAITAFEESKGSIDIAQIEGFVRQIIGWREYIRGIYWANMPNYQEKNALSAQRALPDYFWTGKTKMQCMQQSIQQSLDYAYAHHIQRLMVTGNFCLLTGIHPDEVDAWYLGIYIDAIEWVEMPNTRGMSQFADGGIVATKPYTSSGNYINKMSDYCKSCHYAVKEKVSEDGCPFNSLYWGFMIQHREKFEKNPRIGMVYRNWDKQDKSMQQATLKRANWCLENINAL